MDNKMIIRKFKCSSCTTTISLVEKEKEIYLWCPKCQKSKKFKAKDEGIIFDLKGVL